LAGAKGRMAERTNERMTSGKCHFDFEYRQTALPIGSGAVPIINQVRIIGVQYHSNGPIEAQTYLRQSAI